MPQRPAPPPGWDPAGTVALIDAAAARAGDAAAVEAGATWQGLMRRAAGHLARAVVEVAGGSYGRRIVVVVGKGDNGGDGWACAPLLESRGAQVTIVAPFGTATDGSEATTRNRSAWLDRGGRVLTDLSAATEVLDRADVIVDCLLGTGSRGAPTGLVLAAVQAIGAGRASGAVRRRGAGSTPVVACDVPTGVDADFGRVPGAVVTADVTVTFGAVKRGLLLHPAAAHVGRCITGDLGREYPIEATGWTSLTARGAVPPAPPVDAEKRSRGVALVVAGAAGASGAAALCTTGLLSGGAGLVTAAVPKAIVDIVAELAPAAMTRGLPHDNGVVTADAIEFLGDLHRFDVVVAGPGLQPTEGTRAVVDHLRRTAVRLVLDADALNVHRGDPDTLADHHGQLVITPHERELARLAGLDSVVPDRPQVAIDLAKRLGCTVVAKGPGTVVAAADGRVWVTPVGGPALATGGTGDVLAGMVAAAIATAQDVPAAVARAVWQHAFAGQWLGESRAQRLTAEVLAAEVPAALAELGRLADTRPAWPLDGAPAPPSERAGLDPTPEPL